MVQYLKASEVHATKQTECPPFYSASGYGRAIPTPYMVRLGDGRWRRVYVCQFSNAGTAYIKTKADPFLVIDPDVEAMLRDTK